MVEVDEASKGWLWQRWVWHGRYGLWQRWIFLWVHGGGVEGCHGGGGRGVGGVGFLLWVICGFMMVKVGLPW